MDELYHHGILGMKWGVRRYQNKDGSLTSAGVRHLANQEARAEIKKIKASAKADAVRIAAQGRADAKVAKAAAKAQAKLDAAEQKANAKIAKTVEKVQAKSNKKAESNTKSIKDMTNDEIQAKINRIRLENQLKELTPSKEGKVKSFVKKFMGDSVQSAVLEGNKKAFTNATQAWIQEKLNIDINKDGKLVGFKKDNKSSDDNSSSSNGNTKQNKNDKPNTGKTENTNNGKTENTSNGLASKVKSLNNRIQSLMKDDTNAVSYKSEVASTITKELAPEVASIVKDVKGAYDKVTQKKIDSGTNYIAGYLEMKED